MLRINEIELADTLDDLRVQIEKDIFLLRMVEKRRKEADSPNDPALEFLGYLHDDAIEGLYNSTSELSGLSSSVITEAQQQKRKLECRQHKRSGLAG